MECPDLVEDLTRMFGKGGKRGEGGVNGDLTVAPEWKINLSMSDGRVEVETSQGRRAYHVKPIGSSVQELWTCGGLEGYVLKSIRGST